MVAEKDAPKLSENEGGSDEPHPEPRGPIGISIQEAVK
jgi:hypothetical protein